MEPKVTLISWTHDPVETVYLLWEASRKKTEIPSVEQLKTQMLCNLDVEKNVHDTFLKVLTSHIPVSENINFVFLLENVSIAFREQMVRHRVGVKVGERLGVDHIPDLHDSTFWSQTMRVIDMGKFSTDGGYHTPDSIRNNELALLGYQSTIDTIEVAYNNLIALGVPPEDARMVIPMAAQHRISWGINLSTLAHIVSRRSCWIAQAELWSPIIIGMIEEVCKKVDPIFSVLATPPCMRGDEFKGCLHEIDAKARVDGKDPGVPCALHLSHTTTDRLKLIESTEAYKKACATFSDFWKRDVCSGKKI